MTKLIIILTIILLSSCDKNNNGEIDNSDNCFEIDEEVLGICDSTIFKSVKENEIIRIMVDLYFENIPDDEDERKEKVKKLQDEFLKSLERNLSSESFNILSIKRGIRSPWFGMTVDEEALIFICNNEKVKSVQEQKLSFPQN